MSADPPSREPSGQPRASTLRFQSLANRIVRGMLRTPLISSVMGKRLITIYAVGRKTGRQMAIPVAYTRRANMLLVGTPFKWARNLRTGDPVDILLKGKRRTADVEAFTDEPTVTALYGDMARDNKAFANFNKIKIINGEPDPDDLHLAWLGGARAFRLTPR